MKSLVLTAEHKSAAGDSPKIKLVLRDSPKPVPKPDELLIKTGASLICTSDINDIRGDSFGIQLPVILGHEGAGTVEEAGAGTKGFRAGDEVSAHPVVPCYSCEACRRGYPHLCDNMVHLGIDRGGTFAEYFTIRADRARLKPASIDFTSAALMEPVCVCMEAVERANIPEGGTVLIAGDGPFGIIIANLCVSVKRAKTILLGRHAFRMGHADGAINLTEGPDSPADIMDVSGGGVDSAVLCVGNDTALNTCIGTLRPRGTLSVFSAIHGLARADMLRVHIKELNICGSCNDMGYLDDALAWLATGAADKIVTHRYSLDDFETAFDTAANRKSEALKVAFTAFK